jgi:hypothetical protein
MTVAAASAKALSASLKNPESCEIAPPAVDLVN